MSGRPVISWRLLAVGLATAGFIAAASGCSSRQFYDSAQGWQRTECHRMQDPSERQQCLSSTSSSYDDYKRQAERARAGQ